MKLFPLRGRAGRAVGAARRRAARFNPSPVDGLEPRALLAAGNFGLNVEISPFASFVNLLQTTGGWGPLPGSSTPIVLNASGDPESDANLLFDLRVNQSWNGPDPNAVPINLGGTYHLSFNGQAQILQEYPGGSTPFTVQNQVYNIKNNTTTADIVVVAGVVVDFFGIDFVNTQATPNGPLNTGISNAKLIRPGYAANSTQLYTNEFLSALTPYSVLRYLDPDNANNQPFYSGNTLVTVNGSQVDQTGIPWEYLIALANQTNTDMWINIPQGATDDYVTALAGIFKNGGTVSGVTYSGLNSNLKVYLEYSNEVWGGIAADNYYQSQAVQNSAVNMPLSTFPGNLDIYNNPDGSTSTDVNLALGRRYLERTYDIGQIFQSVMGADPTHSRIRPVLGWEEGNATWYFGAMTWFQHYFGSPASAFYGIGTALYAFPSDYTSVDSVINTLSAAEQTETIPNMVAMSTVANYFGLANVSYEGGPFISSYNTTTDPIALAASRDPRMEQVVLQEYTDFFANGGTLGNFYSGPFGTWSPGNEWTTAEMAQYGDPTASPKYRGTVDIANAAPVAVTAGNQIAATGTSEFVASTDQFGSNFSSPSTGQQNFWLLNVAKAGTYDLNLDTIGQAGYAPGQVDVYMNNTLIGGPYNVSASSNNDLGNLTLSAGLNTLSIVVIHGQSDPSESWNMFYYQFQPQTFSLTSVANPVNSVNTASFVGTDTTTGGSWSPTYGSGGYEVIGGATSLPSYATVTPIGTSTGGWSVTAGDTRALPVSPGSSTVVAQCWYGNTFSIDVNMTDGQTHKVSLYVVDWDSTQRSEQISVVDATTGAILDIETASSFHNGEYLTWSVSGHVQFRFTNLSGSNAVVSGIFFNGTSSGGTSNNSSFLGTDTTTGGTWSPTYGSAGYEVIGGTTSLPSYATITPSGTSNGGWTVTAGDVRALPVAPGSNTVVAQCWYGNTFSIDVNMTDGQTHKVSLYVVDWDSSQRTERIDVLNATTGATIDSETVSSFHNGEYLSWALSGNVIFRVTDLSGANAVVNGIFIANATSSGNSASFVGTDTTTGGTWSPTYGSAGYEVIGGTTSLPSYATITPSGTSNGGWTVTAGDVRALPVAPGSNTVVAQCWYGNTFSIDVNMTDGQTHKVSLYVVDWDSSQRTERIDVIDPSTGSVLNSQTVSSFHNGEYLSWTISGHVQFRITDLSGGNAVVSGIFIGGTSNGNSTSPFLGTDTKTGGTWSPTYGSAGYGIVGGQISLPSYATVTTSGASFGGWSVTAGDTRALPVAPGSSTVVAQCLYGSTFSIDVNMTDSQTHDVSLYLVDWDSTQRTERIDVLNATTGATIDSETVSSFHNGEYLSWALSGNVIFRVTDLAGSNAVVSGIFFSNTTANSATAKFNSTDTTTGGTWSPTYGSSGYEVIGGQTSLPSYAAITTTGASTGGWSVTAGDTRALPVAPGSTTKVAGCWYGNSFVVNINLTDGQPHKITLYVVDWDSTSRDEQIDVLDATSGSVLNTQTVSSFHGGEYLTWTVTGNVQFRFTDLGGSNAVVSGIFIS